MKKSVKIIAALCLMAVLILSLAACGDKKDELIGMWETVIYGNKATMLINEDGTLYLLEIDNDGDIDGEVDVWRLEGNELVVFEKDNYEDGDTKELARMTIGDDTLSFTSGKETAVFKKQ